MTQEEITALAREAGATKFYQQRQSIAPDNYLVGQAFLERFADLVATKARAEERDACMRICLHYANAKDYGGNEYMRSHECQLAANAIRARGTPDDLTQLTERGAKAWAGVDAQKLRDGDWP